MLGPAPVKKTWRESVITLRANVIGFFTRVTPEIAPQLRSRPSMIAASSSFLPSWVKTAPLPALNRGESSR